MFITRKEKRFTTLEFPKQCPLALIVKEGWRLGTAFVSEQGHVTRSGFLRARRKQEREVDVFRLQPGHNIRTDEL